MYKDNEEGFVASLKVMS